MYRYIHCTKAGLYLRIVQVGHCRMKIQDSIKRNGFRKFWKGLDLKNVWTGGAESRVDQTVTSSLTKYSFILGIIKSTQFILTKGYLAGTDLGPFTGGSSFISAREARRTFFGTPWNSLEPPVGGSKGSQGVSQDSSRFKLSSIVQLKLHKEKDSGVFYCTLVRRISPTKSS